jgi:hypothetical protein
MTLHSANFNQIQPDQAVAICSAEHAAQLAEFDGYQVTVAGRIGVLRTREWLPLESHTGPFILTVVFHHVEMQPPAPEHLQAIIDGLKFQIRGQAR